VVLFFVVPTEIETEAIKCRPPGAQFGNDATKRQADVLMVILLGAGSRSEEEFSQLKPTAASTGLDVAVRFKH
jgi:hypothetical protein